jgi:hypothetical protein
MKIVPDIKYCVISLTADILKIGYDHKGKQPTTPVCLELY